MNKVVLREVALTDLSLRFARDMGENKIRHYRLSWAELYCNPKADLVEIVKDFIRKREGETEFEVIYQNSDANKGKLEMVDASEAVLAGLPEGVLGSEVNRLIVEKNIKTPLKLRFFNPLKKLANVVIILIDRVLARLHGTTLQELCRYENWGAPETVKLIKTFNIYDTYYRQIYPCHFLTVAFEQKDLELAAKVIREDLDILIKNKLIVSHLSPPKVLALADTVGAGENYFALYCFVHIDTDRLAKILGKTLNGLPGFGQLALIGCKNEAMEGEIKAWINDPKNRYQIETVDVGEDAREAWLRQYEEIEKKDREAFEESLRKELGKGDKK